MISTRRRISILMGLALGCSVMIATPSYAATISWTDWSNPVLAVGSTAGSADGTLDGGITVKFTGDVFTTTQVGAGTDTDYWSGFPLAYTSSAVGNAPPPSDVIALIGGGDRVVTQTLTFSGPTGWSVVDPVMAILSLGQLSVPVNYDFGSTLFTRLNQGAGYFDPSFAGTLTPLSGNVLTGNEGHGIIQLTGIFDYTNPTLTWTVPNPENWHGFTLGIASTNVPEPASLMLLGAGLAAIGIWRRKAGKIG
jgi:hypothetical protein